MATVEEALAVAVDHHVAGRLGEAETLYARILAVAPDHSVALHYRGLLAAQTGRAGLAATLLRLAVAGAPDRADSYAALARLDEAAGRHDGAALARQRALVRLDPGDAGARARLGWLERGLGRTDAAALAYTCALALDPALVMALNNLANLLREAGAARRAVIAARAAVALAPAVVAVRMAEAQAHAALGDRGAAAAAYAAALALAPAEPEAALGLALEQADGGRPDAAEAWLWRALRLRPGAPRALYALGTLVMGRGRFDAAQALFRGAPGDPGCRVGLVMSALRYAYEDPAAAAAHRTAYASGLDVLLADFGPAAPAAARAAAAHTVGTHRPFLLAYHDVDVRSLQTRYGALAHALMDAAAAALPGGRPEAPASLPAGAPASPPPGAPAVRRGRLRVAVVGAHFRDHSVWRAILKGWVTLLDPDRVSLTGFATGGGGDQQTAVAAAHMERLHRGARPWEAWAEAIVAARPDAVIYPEIGMDAACLQLAAQRLAPLQAASWGHPVTTGLPTVDAYLSGDLLEPEDGADHYSETLVRLPNLGVHLTPGEVVPAAVDRGALGVPAGAVLYLCVQSLFKYQPGHDGVFPAIAAAVPAARFLFVRHSHTPVTATLCARLDRAFAAAGLAAGDHVIVVDPLPHDRYLGLLRAADVYLDSLGFSGFNTAVQAVEAGLPVVTCARRFMRGRLAAAVLARIGAGGDGVAQTLDGYVERAVALGRDAALRRHVAARQTAGMGRLYGDRAAVDALADWLGGGALHPSV